MPGNTKRKSAYGPKGARPPHNTASINIRLSREASEENLSLDGMEADCRAVADRMGLTVVAVHVDDGISGAVRNRPGFVAWLNDAREGRVDHLIAWHVDRMTREGVNVAAQILDVVEGKDTDTGRLVRHPVRLLDTKGLDSGGDDTAFRFALTIKAEVARAERERMRDRARAAHTRLSAAGRWGGGPTPYGFRAAPNPDGAGKVLVQDEAEVAVVREIATRIIDGALLGQVVKWLNGPDGHRPRRAKWWAQTTVRQTMLGAPVSGSRGEARGGVVPILSADEAAAIRTILTRKNGPNYPGRKPTRVGSGIFHCATCGTKMITAYRGVPGGGPGAPQYRCNAHRLFGTCDSPVAVDSVLADAWLTKYFLERFGDRDEYRKRMVVTGAAEVEAAQMVKDQAVEALSLNPTAEAFAEVQAAQAALEKALTVPQSAETHVLPTGRLIAQAWKEGDLDDRRALLMANIAFVRVAKAGRGGSQERKRDVGRRMSVVHTTPVVVDDPATYREGTMGV